MQPKWFVQLVFGVGLALLGAALRTLLTDKTFAWILLVIAIVLIVGSGLAWYREASEVSVTRRQRQLRINATCGTLTTLEKEALSALVEFGGLTENQISARVTNGPCDMNGLNNKTTFLQRSFEGRWSIKPEFQSAIKEALTGRR